MAYPPRKTTEDPKKQLAIIVQNAASAAANIVATQGLPVVDFVEIHRMVLDSSLSLISTFGGGTTSAEVVKEEFQEARPAPRRTNQGGTQDPLSMELSFGKHRGQTIGDVLTQGDDGVSYIEWVAENSNNDTMRAAAKQALASV